MTEEKRCIHCQATVPAHSPHGLCPRCLLKRGLETQTQYSQEGSPTEATECAPPTPEEMAGLFPDLEILELIGRGGMGVVYKARQKRLNRLVALKILSPRLSRDAAFAERFVREARAMAMLNHPHIVAVYDFGEVDGIYYFLMEFVDGVNLRRLLDAGKLASEEALAIVPQVCDALQYAHDHGVVHRDIKPENVLMDKEGRVKIADFGIAKLVGVQKASLQSQVGEIQSGESKGSHSVSRPIHEPLTEAGQVVGTPRYMAPEQVETPQQVDHRADIYSLGVVFYQMLTGELPTGGHFEPPSKKVQIDVRLDEVVLRAMEKEPARRYQQVSEVKTKVENIATTAPHPHHDDPPIDKPDPETETLLQEARKQVKGPAIGLLVTGIFTWGTLGILLVIVSAVVSTLHIPGEPSTSLIIALMSFGILMIFAGLKMKRLQAYGLAVTASILAIIISPSNVIGLPIGIWALVVLSQREVRAAFRKNRQLYYSAKSSEGTRKPGLLVWRVAVVALLLVLVGLLVAGMLYVPDPLPGRGHVFEESLPPRQWFAADHADAPRIDSVLIEDGKATIEGDAADRSILIFSTGTVESEIYRFKESGRFTAELRTVGGSNLVTSVFGKRDAQLLTSTTNHLGTVYFPPNRLVFAGNFPKPFPSGAIQIAQIQGKDGKRWPLLARLETPSSPDPKEDSQSQLKVDPKPTGPTTEMMRALAERICDGDEAAFEELREVAEELYRDIDYRKDTERVGSNLVLMLAAFNVLGEQAAYGNENAFTALKKSLGISRLKAFAPKALGVAAAAGHEESLEILLHYRKWGILLSSTVFALQKPAEKNDPQAVDFLIKVLEDPSARALWFGASQGLVAARIAGNEKAIAALKKYEEATKKDDEKKPRILPTGNIRPLDLLEIHAINTLKSQPINNFYLVEPDGNVSLGPVYGRANVKGVSMEQAEKNIVKQLEKTVRDPSVQVTLARRGARWRKAVFLKNPYTIGPSDVLRVKVRGALRDQPIDNHYLVESKGTVPLGAAYGRVAVKGLTLAEAEAAIQKHLETILTNPEVQVTLPQNFVNSPAVRWEKRKPPIAPYRIRLGELLFVNVAGTLPDQPIQDVYLVEPDGTIALGPAYGRVKVQGLTLQKIEAAIQKKLKTILQ
ncbi:MAG: polysaccharide biosynthesis/export family protein, partial [Planctomycetia bacterium]